MLIIGKYNVEDCGYIWDKNKRYTMVIFTEFDNKDRQINKKVIYFTGKILNFKTENQIEAFLSERKNYQRVTWIENYIKVVEE